MGTLNNFLRRNFDMKLLRSGLLCLCLLLSQGGLRAQAIKIETDNYIMETENTTSAYRPYIKNKQSQNLLQIGLLKLGWTPALTPNTAKYQTIQENGSQGILATYGFASSVPFTLTGKFIAHPNRIDVQYDITNIPADYKTDWGGCQFRFSLLALSETTKLADKKLGIWKRHEYGGLPVEAADASLQSMLIKDNLVALAFGAENPINTAWQDNNWRHTVLVRNEDGSLTSKFSILIAPEEWTIEALSANWQDRPFALSLSTDKVYNWWDSASESLKVNANIVNTTNTAQTFNLKYWVKSFDGSVILDETKEQTLGANATLDYPISFTSPSERDLFFVEVSIEDMSGKELVFSRTNLSMLPAHTFTSTPDNNIMGLSAAWELPNAEEYKRLLKRMGVRWLRNGKAADLDNIQAMYHNNIDWTKTYTAEDMEQVVKEHFETIVANGNTIWEFGNELNMSTGGIALEGDGIGKALLAEPYVAWLKEIKRVQAENTAWQHIKVISFGFAGTDSPFFRKIAELGGWDLLDGIALHPGRGNFAPDHPIVSPWDSWTMPGSGYPYWNYYGSIRHAKNLIAELGGNKDLYLTEIYALDFPNQSWNDTPRGSAENVVLSYALAAAEGVKNALYYQLFNSVWFDQLGVKEKEREYFFGLINRDYSFKPSFMAYCAISEALDGAAFRGWIKFPTKNSKSKGLLFDTPRGPMCVLWDRTDGYILTQSAPNYASPEAWVDTWRSEVPVSLPSEGGNLTVLNAIGQEQSLAANDGTASLTLKGSPMIVYGVDTSRVEIHGIVSGIESMINDKKISVYPSIVKDSFVLDGALNSDTNNLKIGVYNSIGQLVYSENLSASAGYVNHKVDVNKLQSGIYYVVIVTDNGDKITEKLIKE